MTPPFSTAPSLRYVKGITHGFFGRRGGVSTGLYESLNAGEGSDDAPEAVAENRTRIAAALKTPVLLSCHQVHSPDVVRVREVWDTRPQADAMVTDQPGLGLCILTADCTPVLFVDPTARVIGAAHAGWKGALKGVLLNTIRAMEALGADRDKIRCAIGPTIGQASYEVGPEFRETFLLQEPGSADLFRPGQGDRFHFDLPGYCQRQLIVAGVSEVFNLCHDTCAMEESYFSNRRRNLRGEADYGRNAAAIAILP